MTIRDFILKTVDSYMDLKINAYVNGKIKETFEAKKHNWNCADVPSNLLDLEISSIIPYYDHIILEVNLPNPPQQNESPKILYWIYQITLYNDGYYNSVGGYYNIVGDSGDVEFKTKKEAKQDAENFIMRELSKEYNKEITDFNIITYPVYDK